MAADSESDTQRTTIAACCFTQGIDEAAAPGATIRRAALDGAMTVLDPMAHVTAVPARTPGVASLERVLAQLPRLTIGNEDDESSELCLLTELGRGGMGIVHLARQRSLDRDVAIKAVRPDSPPESAAALLREAKLCGALEHPNVVPVHSLGRDGDGQPQIVMKRVVGQSWEELLEGRVRDDHGCLSDQDLDRELDILTSVCHAVEFAHSRGVVHRDIKPANVMVGDFGEVTLLDWGVGLRLKHLDREPTGIILGSPAYMAPEMVTGDSALVTERTDVYLLGATLHEVLTGTLRHGGETVVDVLLAATQSRPQEYADAVPAELAGLCNDACSRDPLARHATVQAWREAIAAYRRHRGSVKLADAALVLTEELRELSQPDRGEADDERPSVELEEAHLRVHRLFSQCRFGFEHALREWPDNEQATGGMQRCLELMIEHELAGRNHGAAQALLDALPKPRKALRQRLDALRQELKADEDARSTLQRLRWENRFQGRDLKRSLAALGTGLVWTVALVVAAALIRMGVVRPSALLNLVFMLVGIAEAVLAAIWIRAVLFENRIFRKFYFAVSCTIAALLLSRVLALQLDISFHQTLVFDFVLLALGLGVVASTLVSRLWIVAALAALGALVAAWWPAGAVELLAGFVFLSHLWVAWALRPPSGPEDEPLSIETGDR